MSKEIQSYHLDRISLICNSKDPAEVIEHSRYALSKSQSDLLIDETEHEGVFKAAFSKYNTMTTLFSPLQKEALYTILKRYRKKGNIETE